MEPAEGALPIPGKRRVVTALSSARALHAAPAWSRLPGSLRWSDWLAVFLGALTVIPRHRSVQCTCAVLILVHSRR